MRELQYIQFPATNTGYQLIYSDYGMAYKVSLQRQAGTVESASATFNYPTSGSTVLTDAPSFTQRVESPNSGTYSYSSSTDNVAQTKTFTITKPDSSTVALTRSTNTSLVANGLLTQAELKDSTGHSMAKSAFVYANDPGGSPQVQSVITCDDGTPTPNQTQISFDYDSLGDVTNKREFGFQQSGSWVVRRRTHVNFTSAGGAIVPTEVDTYDAQLNNNDADDVLIAKTTYDVDNYSYPFPLNGIEDYGGTANPPGHYSAFNAIYTNRGNLTAVTQWSDITGNVSINRETRYDIFGNIAKAQVSCCNQKSLTFDQTTYWADPTQVTSGDPNGIHLTNASSYDFNTTQVVSYTDPNSLSTSVQYDTNLRPITATLPTGATANASFSDGSLSATSWLSYTDNGVNKTPTTGRVADGWGHVLQATDSAGNQVNYAYNNMGLLQSRTNPFPQNGTPGPATTFVYDALGRIKTSTLPDGNTLRLSYNGNTMTTTDQVGRQFQRQVDGLGRLITATEQDPSTGSLTLATNYSYDYLNDLTQVNQGGQLRSWKYDALGRMLYERIPEQSASINDGTGTMWSCRNTYTDFGAVATQTDARGVIITYGYDSMNRLFSVTYDVSHASGVAVTPSVTYTYDNSSTSSTKGLLLSVTMGSLFQESYSYDSTNRPSSVTDTIEGKTYTKGYQYNTAGQTTQLTYPSQRVLPVGYDSAGRLYAVGSTGQNGCAGYLCGISYNSAEAVSGFTLGNGVGETFGYDTNRLQPTSQTAVKGSTTLLSLNYSYTAAAGQMGLGTTPGNTGDLVTLSGTINGATESAAYSYDLLQRQVTSSQTSNGSSAQRRFSYDRWANRTGVWDSTSGGNQIQGVVLQQAGSAPTNQIQSVTGSGAGTYAYDAAGNVTSDGAHTYGYDGQNRLVSVDGGTTSQYAYDFKNRRIKKVSSGTTTHCIWQGNHVLAEHDGNTGNPLVDYIFASGNFIAKVQASGTTSYFIADRVSERLKLDANGNVLGQQGHLPYGDDFGESGQVERHHFTSYERDAETSEDYAVNRYYSDGLGRFTTVDPMRSSGRPGFPGTWNRYAYAAGEPINRKDPRGLILTNDCPECASGDPCNSSFYDISRFDDFGGSTGSGSYDAGGSAFSGPPSSGPGPFFTDGEVCDQPAPGGGDPGGGAPAMCQMSFNTTPGNSPLGSYPVGARFPNVDPTQAIGPGYDASNNFYYYFFEVVVEPVNDPSQQFIPRQWKNIGGSLTVQLPDGSVQTVAIGPRIGPDNPDPHNVSPQALDQSTVTYMTWLDSPGFGVIPGYKIIGADMTFNFTFQAVDPNTRAVGCGGSLTLHWKFGPGTGIDDPLKGWTITGAATY